MADRQQVKVTFSGEDIEVFNEVKSFLRITSDAEVLRVTLNICHELLKIHGTIYVSDLISEPLNDRINNLKQDVDNIKSDLAARPTTDQLRNVLKELNLLEEKFAQYLQKLEKH